MDSTSARMQVAVLMLCPSHEFKGYEGTRQHAQKYRHLPVFSYLHSSSKSYKDQEIHFKSNPGYFLQKLYQLLKTKFPLSLAPSLPPLLSRQQNNFGQIPVGR